LRGIGTGDAGRGPLSFLDLLMEEDEAVLVLSEEFLQSDVL
jgi:hypothetical protein